MYQFNFTVHCTEYIHHLFVSGSAAGDENDESNVSITFPFRSLAIFKYQHNLRRPWQNY